MKLIHFADVHLGFTAGDRVTSTGGNRREDDVARTFGRLIDRVVELRPDVVVVAGDIVHVARPSNNTILTVVGGFARLTSALPNAVFVCALGNHDISKTTGDASILRLLTPFGVHIAEREAKRFYFPDRDLSVLAVPDAPGLVRPALTPDSRARHNVLVLHGDVQGVKQGGAEYRASASEVTTDELGVAAWSYCAFGHYHQYELLAPNAAYAGSMDYTSSNIWGELATPKGFIERDLVTGAHTFHALPPARPVMDLPRLDVTGLTPEEISTAIAAAVDAQPIDDVIARLVVVGAPRGIRKDLDHKAIRAWRKRAMAFTLTVETEEPVVGPLSTALHDSNLTRESLEQIVDRKLEGYNLTPGVDRSAFTALGKEYLERAREKAGEQLASEPISIEPAAAQQRRAS